MRDNLELPESRPLLRKLDLPAHRGIVLLKAGRAIGNSDNPRKGRGRLRPRMPPSRFKAGTKTSPPFPSVALLQDTGGRSRFSGMQAAPVVMAMLALFNLGGGEIILILALVLITIWGQEVS